MTRFQVSHSKKARFERRGLRSYFEYRDLGIRRATRGKVVAHVIRARPGTAPHGEWHYHDVDVQFVYVLKGWVLFEYEGVGKVRMKAGSCFYQPPRIRHRELKHSKDVEMLEIVSPAKFETFEAKPAVRGVRAPSPNCARRARKSPARRSRG
jgi:mannose-6-phosphate isomerase-like protein (cupin superfamily)